MATVQPTWFVAGDVGLWNVERMEGVAGEPLLRCARIAIHEAMPSAPLLASCAWALQGTSGHVRYVERAEKQTLAAVTPPLSRPEATCAALIPIRKSQAWWDLAQDERRAVLEANSKHITIGLDYLPAVARRLYQSRELGEPFDFLTWFEFAPEHASRFEELLGRLRETEEWSYVEREVDIRLARGRSATAAQV